MSTETQPAAEPKSLPQVITDPAMIGALQLTDVAADKVREIRDAETIEPHYALRVKVPGNPHPWYKLRGQ